MQVARNTVVRLRYRISDAQGQVIDPGDEPLEYLHGGYGEFFDTLEAQIEGAEPGFEQEFHLEPEQGFGEYDASLLRIVPRSAVPAEVVTGVQFEGLPGGSVEDRERIFTVTDIDDEGVVLDGNHPLAGIALHVWVQIMSVREATADEIDSGRPASDEMSVVGARSEDESLH